MKILILGGKGNLGTQLTRIFADEEAVAWDREDLDFLDREQLLGRLGGLTPDVVINAAAYNAVDKCEVEATEKELAYRLNRDLPANLAQWCLSVGKRLIHYSTDYVFSGDKKKQSFREDEKTGAINEYGRSKAAGEAAILPFIEQGLRLYLIRTSKLFGPAGSSPFAKPSFFDAIRRLVREKGRASVVDGEYSCFTYTPDLADATLSLLHSRADSGIYHLVNDGPATWYEGASVMFDILGETGKIDPISTDAFPRPAKRPEYSILENTKRPLLRDFREALTDYLRNNK